MMHIHIDQIPKHGLQLEFAEKADVFPFLAAFKLTITSGNEVPNATIESAITSVLMPILVERAVIA